MWYDRTASAGWHVASVALMLHATLDRDLEAAAEICLAKVTEVLLRGVDVLRDNPLDESPS